MTASILTEEIAVEALRDFFREKPFLLVYGSKPYWREKLSSLSEFVREIKAGFARF